MLRKQESNDRKLLDVLVGLAALGAILIGLSIPFALKIFRYFALITIPVCLVPVYFYEKFLRSRLR